MQKRVQFAGLFAGLLLFSTAVCSCAKKCNTGTPVGDCVCTEEYNPVCGSNNVTYDNPCYAECAGVKDYKAGACTSK